MTVKPINVSSRQQRICALNYDDLSNTIQFVTALHFKALTVLLLDLCGCFFCHVVYVIRTYLHFSEFYLNKVRNTLTCSYRFPLDLLLLHKNGDHLGVSTQY